MKPTNASPSDIVALTSVASEVYHLAVVIPDDGWTRGYTGTDCGFETSYLVPWEEIAETHRPCIRCYPPDAD